MAPGRRCRCCYTVRRLMFIGHIAVGLAAKRAAPRTSLGTLLMAAQLPDLLWPIFILLGLERVSIIPGTTAVSPLAFPVYPISHSLLAVTGWATLSAGIYLILKRHTRGAATICIAVLSHWFLDALSHSPDMPLTPAGSTLVGLGLWNSFAWTVIVELGMFIVGLKLYLWTARAKDQTGVYGFWSLIGVLIGLYILSLLGPPPPSVRAVAVVGMLAWLFILWACWADRHRVVYVEAIPDSPDGM